MLLYLQTYVECVGVRGPRTSLSIIPVSALVASSLYIKTGEYFTGLKIFFSCSTQISMKFILLINVKVPSIVAF